MTRRDWSLLLALAAIWGASYLFIKIGIRDMSAPMVVFLRVGLGALVLLGIAHGRGALRGFGALLPVLVVVAAVQVAGPFLLITLGEQEISSALAGILVAAAPIFTAILAVFVDEEERSRGLRLLGVIAGIVGVGVLLGVDLGGGAELLGGLAVVLAALGYAIGGLITKKRLSGMQPLGIAAAVLAISTVLSAPIAALTLPDQTPGLGPIAAVVVLGVLGTGLAFAIFYALIARIGPARSFIVTYLAPGFAVVYGATLLDETISVATIAGLALILGGSYLAVEGAPPGRRPTREPAPADSGASGFAPARD